MSLKKFPVKVSVVTVVYNACETIGKTVASVISQSYTNFEYIIIDGGSTDNTVSIVRNMAPDSVVISEKDLGIYDAMNKATAVATGDWIIYMNAGDSFACSDVLTHVFSTASLSNYGIIYGDIMAQYSDYRLIMSPQPLKSIWRGKPFHHQASFVRTSLARKYPFDLQYRICSDHDFAYKLFNEGIAFLYVPILVAEVDFVNSSVGSDYRDVWAETFAISEKHNTSRWNALRLYCHSLRVFVTKRILPARFVRLVRSFKYSQLNRQTESLKRPTE